MDISVNRHMPHRRLKGNPVYIYCYFKLRNSVWFSTWYKLCNKPPLQYTSAISALKGSETAGLNDLLPEELLLVVPAELQLQFILKFFRKIWSKMQIPPKVHAVVDTFSARYRWHPSDRFSWWTTTYDICLLFHRAVFREEIILDLEEETSTVCICSNGKTVRDAA